MSDESIREELPETRALAAPAPARYFVVPALDAPPDQWPCSLRPDTPQGRSAMVKLAGPADKTVDSLVGEDLLVVGYLMYPTESVDEETGEVTRYVRLTLLLDDGVTVSSTGPVVLKKWALIVRYCGVPSSENPIGIRFALAKSKRPGRTFHDVELIPYE